MIGMIAHHTGNMLFESTICPPPPFNRTRKTSNYSSSSTSVPEMISSASVQSFTESDDTASLDDALSSSSRCTPQGLVRSPRSIFTCYWSSPSHENTFNEISNNVDVLERVRTLKMPTTDERSVDSGDYFPKIPHPVIPMAEPSGEQPYQELSRASGDDLIDYRPSLKNSHNAPLTTAPRRRILPTPPPPTAIPPLISMSRLLSPPRSTRGPYGERPWSSTTALLVNDGRGGVVCTPSHSCLRKPRYSFSCQELAAVATEAGAQEVDPTSSMCRSVSFHSEVRVVEYDLPMDQRRGQEGWSKYFF